MNKLLGFFLSIVFVLSFSFALSFPGESISFKDLNMPTIFKKDSCVQIPLASADKNLLMSTPGVLGLLLHFKEGAPEDFVYVISDLGVLYSRNIFGFNVNHRHFVSEAQRGYLYIDLESVRKGNLDLFLCVSASDKIELYDDSEIGSYKIPYFGEENFTKSFKEKPYKINEKSRVEVKLKNAGYSDVNVFLFYDNEIFTKWFKLGEGTPSVTEKLKPNEVVSLEYTVVPLTGKLFTVSPAVVRYSVGDYVFTEYSNGLISDAKAYLDELFVTVSLSSTNFDINEKGTLQIKIYNDSNRNKDVILVVSGLKEFGLDEKYQINLKPFETKNMSFTISSPKEQIVTFKVSLIAGDKEKTEKQYDSQTVYFGKKIKNYTYIYVIIGLILVFGIGIYYKFLL